MKENNYPRNEFFDVIDMGGSDICRYITVSYKDCRYIIPQEKMWHVLNREYSKDIDYWFNEAKYTRPLCSEVGDNVFMPAAVGGLTCLIHENGAVLPIRNIDIGKLRDIANSTSPDFDSYFMTLINNDS